MKHFAVVCAILLFASTIARAQDKPTLSVHAFTLAQGVVWPYDAEQMRIQTIVQLKVKDAEHFNIVADDAKSPFTLNGEILSWHAGNKAKRMLVGAGSGRETAEIHYWLTDAAGKRIFEHTDTIRQAFWGNAYAESVGGLAQPFADKIAERLKAAKLF